MSTQEFECIKNDGLINPSYLQTAELWRRTLFAGLAPNERDTCTHSCRIGFLLNNLFSKKSKRPYFVNGQVLQLFVFADSFKMLFGPEETVYRFPFQIFGKEGLVCICIHYDNRVPSFEVSIEHPLYSSQHCLHYGYSLDTALLVVSSTGETCEQEFTNSLGTVSMNWPFERLFPYLRNGDLFITIRFALFFDRAFLVQ